MPQLVERKIGVPPCSNAFLAMCVMVSGCDQRLKTRPERFGPTASKTDLNMGCMGYQRETLDFEVVLLI